MYAKLLTAFALLLATACQAALAAPAIQSWQTDNGARVLFVESHNLPIVDVRVVFDAGAARDGEQAGLARLTSSLLMQGTENRDAQAIARAFESVGARHDSGSRRDMAFVSLRSLSAEAQLRPAVDMLAEVLNAPVFPESALERQRRRMLLAVQARRQDPGSVAQRAFYETVYGDHPYAGAPGGEPETLEALDREAVRAFYERHYVGANATVAVMGDLDEPQARELVDQLVGELPRGEAAPALPPVPELEQAKTVRIPFPSEQAHILVGQPGMARNDEDYFPLYLANHVLGGSGFSSRLMQEIREDRGLAYSVYSYFLPMAQRGPFLMGMQTKLDQTDRAVGLLRKNLEAFVANGPTEAEMQHARQNLTGGFPRRIDSNREITQYLAMIGFYDLPLDYLDRFVERVRSVDREAAHEAFRERIDPDHLVTVIVGGEQADDGS